MKNRKIILILNFFLVVSVLFSSLGSGGLFKKDGFVVDSTLLKVVLKEDATYTGEIKISNTEDSSKYFEIEIMGLENLVSIDTTKFTLSLEEIKKLNVEFSNRENLEKGIYLGKLKISDSETVKIVPIVVELESKNVLFDSGISLFPIEKVEPGGVLNTEIKIVNFIRLEEKIIDVNYFIRDFENYEIFSETEKIDVAEKLDITKTFKLPNDIPKGDYIFGVIVESEGSIGTHSAPFKVGGTGFFSSIKDMDFTSSEQIYFIGFLVVVAFIFIIFYLEKRHMKDIVDIQAKEINRINKKVKDKKVIASEATEIRKRLKKRLLALEKAKSEGYISKESFNKGKGRITRLLKKI